MDFWIPIFHTTFDPKAKQNQVTQCRKRANQFTLAKCESIFIIIPEITYRNVMSKVGNWHINGQIENNHDE